MYSLDQGTAKASHSLGEPVQASLLSSDCNADPVQRTLATVRSVGSCIPGASIVVVASYGCLTRQSFPRINLLMQDWIRSDRIWFGQDWKPKASELQEDINPHPSSVSGVPERKQATRCNKSYKYTCDCKIASFALGLRTHARPMLRRLRPSR